MARQQNTIFYFARRWRLPAGDEHSEQGNRDSALSPLMRCSLGCMAYIAGSSEDRQQTGHLSYSSLPLPPPPPVLLLQGTQTPQSDSLSNREAQQRQSLLPLEETKPQAALTSTNLNQPQPTSTLPHPVPFTFFFGSGSDAQPACPHTPAAAATSWCCHGRTKTGFKPPTAFDSQFSRLVVVYMSFN